MSYLYYYFGSEDSTDIDVLVDHADASGTEVDLQLIPIVKQCIKKSASWDINIIRIKDGFVSHSIPSKGSPDAVNNSLFATYKLHRQSFELPIKGNLPRNNLLALVKCIRMILTQFKKCSNRQYYESKIRPAIKENFYKWINILIEIDWAMFTFNDEADKINAFKKIAFNIGQTISLLKGIEIYTKSSLKNQHPLLSQFIDRTNTNNSEIICSYATQLHDLLITYPINIVNDNVIECNGEKVDFRKELDAGTFT